MKWTAKRHRDYLETGVLRHRHRVRLGFILQQLTQLRHRPGGALRILDAGCGDGVIIGAVAERFPTDRVDAVDLDPVRLARAGDLPQRVRLHHADVRYLPFQAGVFDVVICSSRGGTRVGRCRCARGVSPRP